MILFQSRLYAVETKDILHFFLDNERTFVHIHKTKLQKTEYLKKRQQFVSWSWDKDRKEQSTTWR